MTCWQWSGSSAVPWWSLELGEEEVCTGSELAQTSAWPLLIQVSLKVHTLVHGARTLYFRAARRASPSRPVPGQITWLWWEKGVVLDFYCELMTHSHLLLSLHNFCCCLEKVPATASRHIIPSSESQVMWRCRQRQSVTTVRNRKQTERERGGQFR